MARVTLFLLILIFASGCTNQNNLVHRQSVASRLGITTSDHTITQSRNGVYVVKYNTTHNSVGYDPFANLNNSSKESYGPAVVKFY
jgi:hypothetical protein